VLRRLLAIFMEVAGPVLPVTVVIVILQLLVVKLPGDLFARFGLGVALVLIGLFVFMAGVRIGLLPIGSYIGSRLPERVGPAVMLAVVFVLGFVFTLAEPDVRVLSISVEEVTGGSVGSNLFLLIVSLGLGLALAGAVVRQLLRIRLALVFGLGYGLVLALLPFVSPQFVALGFDSGSTTTGTLSVPLILALGIGVARVIGRSSTQEGFGLIGIASLGPVLLLTIIGLFA
jgi:hypothetical protein